MKAKKNNIDLLKAEIEITYKAFSNGIEALVLMHKEIDIVHDAISKAADLLRKIHSAILNMQEAENKKSFEQRIKEEVEK